MAEPLDETYLRWLYSQIASPRLRSPSKTYWKLARSMYTTEFVWLVPNDDNRVEDGRYLRHEFLEASGVGADDHWLSLGCSFFEMVIALSRRLAFEAQRTPSWWFWLLMKNIGLQTATDDVASEELIEQILYTVIFRTYSPRGEGGLFPLVRPDKDQRRVELWYQLQAYLLENDYM